MKFEKNNIIEKIFFNDEEGINQLKKKVYSGKIVYLNNFYKTFVLKQSIEKMFSRFFNISLFHYLAGNTISLEEKKVINFQNLIKNSSEIRNIFKKFLKDLNFDLKDSQSLML